MIDFGEMAYRSLWICAAIIAVVAIGAGVLLGVLL